jgi:hypothetical protein
MCQEKATVPADEIEVTDEMRAAGANEFYQWDGLMFGTAEGAAVAIFKAMAALSPRFCNQTEPESLG